MATVRRRYLEYNSDLPDVWKGDPRHQRPDVLPRLHEDPQENLLRKMAPAAWRGIPKSEAPKGITATAAGAGLETFARSLYAAPGSVQQIMQAFRPA